MSRHYLTNYQPLEGSASPREKEEEDLSPDVHPSILIHRVPDPGKTQWNHIEDLDFFFTKIYRYHQSNGFMCMMVKQLLNLAILVFVVGFTTFLATCVDYQIMFGNKPPNGVKPNSFEKITLWDCIYPEDKIPENFTWKINLVLIIAGLFWCLKVVQFFRNYYQFKDTKQFYEVALGIKDNIRNFTWEEVQQRILEVQVERRMCIHKENLTELDINHRILRFTNYFVAMVNKDLLPLKLRVPFVGETIFLTRGLIYNLELVFFWGPWALFKNSWHLKEEYKKHERRHELAKLLRKLLIIIAVVNLILFPFIFIWHVLFCFYTYAGIMKREPSFLGSRRWSHYGEIYLRHFNELDHELRARLNRGYKPARQYLNIFESHLLSTIAEFVAFVFGSFLAVFLLLTVIDEDVLQVEHAVLCLTVSGLVVAAARTFIPDENLVWCPELLMKRVLAEVHYLPDTWQGKAHTTQVRQSFAQLFQYKLVHILEEVLSPLVTPYILAFKVANKSLAIVDFYRNFTVEVTGVGDICSFAQMDIRRHGSQTWQPDMSEYDLPSRDVEDVAMRTAGGKTELSLLHFTLTNPNWQPPQESSLFLNALKDRAQKDYTTLGTVNEENPLSTTMDSLSDSIGLGAVGKSIIRAPFLRGMNAPLLSGMTRQRRSYYQGQDQTREENQGVLASLSTSACHPFSSSLEPPNSPRNSLLHIPCSVQPQDLTAIDVSFSALYLHELHQQRRTRANYVDMPLVRNDPPYCPPGVTQATLQGMAAQVPPTPSAEEINSFPPLSVQDDSPPQALACAERIPLLKDT